MCNQFNTKHKQTNSEDTLRADDVLWQNIRQGDREAFAMLFRKYYQTLYRFSGRLVWDAQAAANRVTIFIDNRPLSELLDVIALLNAFEFQEHNGTIIFKRKH